MYRSECILALSLIIIMIMTHNSMTCTKCDDQVCMDSLHTVEHTSAALLRPFEIVFKLMDLIDF